MPLDPRNPPFQVVADAYKLGDVKSGWLTPNFLRAEAGSAGPRCPADVSYARAFHKVRHAILSRVGSMRS